MDKYSVDRVIGIKRCLKCGYPVVVEAYDIPGANKLLERYTVCGNKKEEIYCNGTNFTNPKLEVRMKPYQKWVGPLLKRMDK